MSRLLFSCEPDVGGVVLQLLQKPLIGSAISVPVEDWAERMADRAFTGVSHLLALLDDADSPVDGKVRVFSLTMLRSRRSLSPKHWDWVSRLPCDMPCK
jgi:hypothetical protein